MTEDVLRLSKIWDKVEEQLRKEYGNKQRIYGREAFHISETGYFVKLAQLNFPGEPAIVVEYAASTAAAKINDWDDGDLFFLDYGTEEEIVNAILKEIQREIKEQD